MPDSKSIEFYLKVFSGGGYKTYGRAILYTAEYAKNNPAIECKGKATLS